MLICAQALPAHASSTLLSGYGGPGQGNQAIIGSALIGGGSRPGGGSGGANGAGPSSTSSSPSSSSSSSPSPPESQAPSSMALPSGGAGPTTAGAGSHGARTRGAKRSAPATRTGTPDVAITPVSARSAARGALGLSGADIAYIVLAFGLLALTALLTVRLSRRPGGAGGTQ